MIKKRGANMEKKIEKVVTKLYVVENNKNVVCAEIVNGCGCGFDALIRIKPEYKFVGDIFARCMYYAGIKWENVLQIIHTHKDIMQESYKRGYLLGYEQFAIVIDDIID